MIIVMLLVMAAYNPPPLSAPAACCRTHLARTDRRPARHWRSECTGKIGSAVPAYPVGSRLQLREVASPLLQGRHCLIACVMRDQLTGSDGSPQRLRATARQRHASQLQR